MQTLSQTGSQEYLDYLRDLRDSTQDRLDSYQSLGLGDDLDRCERSELRRRLRSYDHDLSLHGC